MKKTLTVLSLTAVLGFVSMHYGTRGFVYSDPNQVPVENQPIHFQLNPILWLPAYFVFNNDITDLTIVKSVLWTLPYWIFVSYIITHILWSLVDRRRGSYSLPNSKTKT